ILARLKLLGNRLKVILNNDKDHNTPQCSETLAAQQLAASAGPANLKRQHMGNLQHNKTIVVDGARVQAAVCGSTNFSWRGFYVQANNAFVVRGADAIRPFCIAFDSYWNHSDVAGFGKTLAAEMC